MQAEFFVKKIHELGIETITGIPDSTLKTFCDYIGNEGSGLFEYHIVPENEGASVGIAIGEYLATGRPACIYMQNSGLGNAVNPFTSLAHSEVYGIPMLFVIGWRGEPGEKDEPQHKFMGRITTELLHILEIEYTIIDNETTQDILGQALDRAQKAFSNNRQYALIVKPGTFDKRCVTVRANKFSLARERAIEMIVQQLKLEDSVVSTTGKISRELYEQCERIFGNHNQIFLTVGGMGHVSMVAYQLANRNKESKVFCLDGDGSILMHMGSLAVLGKYPVDNLVHVCLNNEAHESVGGMPTGAAGISYGGFAEIAGYKKVYCVKDEVELEEALDKIRKKDEMTFLDISVSLESRANLGRPAESTKENKEMFMKHEGVVG